MPKKIVINTGPLIALIAAFKSLVILQKLYNEVIVPYEVSQELSPKEKIYFGSKIFSSDKWLIKHNKPIKIKPFLKNSLDPGEAAVIQTAINYKIQTVCIDEIVGRRIARINNLKLTGSLGIIISALKSGENIDIRKAIHNMKVKGIWISEKLEKEAIRIADE